MNKTNIELELQAVKALSLELKQAVARDAGVCELLDIQMRLVNVAVMFSTDVESEKAA